MATLLGTYYLACILQVLLVYGLVLWFAAGISPLRFIRDSAELWVYTLSTCSSVAAIPVNMKVAREKFNVPDSISSFTVPLGSSDELRRQRHPLRLRHYVHQSSLRPERQPRK